MGRPLERLAEPRRQLGVVGLPDALAEAEPAGSRSRRPNESRAGPAESPPRGRAAPGPLDLVDAAPLLGDARRVVAVEDEAVAPLHGRGEVEPDLAAVDRLDPAEEDAALLGVVAADEDLVVVAVEEAVAEPSREGQLHLADVVAARTRRAGPARASSMAWR